MISNFCPDPITAFEGPTTHSPSILGEASGWILRVNGLGKIHTGKPHPNFSENTREKTRKKAMNSARGSDPEDVMEAFESLSNHSDAQAKTRKIPNMVDVDRGLTRMEIILYDTL